LFREFWISPGALSAAARGHAPLLALGPSQAPSFVRGELLALPVFSFQKTVLGKEKPRSSGEFQLSGHGIHRAGAGNQPASACCPLEKMWTVGFEIKG
jgi:hypothetical protein